MIISFSDIRRIRLTYWRICPCSLFTALPICFSALLNTIITSSSCNVPHVTEMLGGKVSYHGDYPGWAYARESRLRDLCVKIYEKQYGETPKIEVIHAGLECGILSSKIEGLDCISIGPNMHNVHTSEETLEVGSVQRTWEFLCRVIAQKS